MILDDYTDVDTSSLSDTLDSESGSIPLLYPSEIIPEYPCLSRRIKSWSM